MMNQGDDFFAPLNSPSCPVAINAAPKWYADTVVLAICSLLVALDAFVDRLGTPDEAAEVKELVNEYRQLHEEPETH